MSTIEQPSGRGSSDSDGIPASVPGPDSIPSSCQDIVARQVSGETILVPIKSRPGDLSNIFTLNEVASRTWELIDGHRSVSEIAEVISNEFDVEVGRALTDTSELIGNFRDAEVVSIHD